MKAPEGQGSRAQGHRITWRVSEVISILWDPQTKQTSRISGKIYTKIRHMNVGSMLLWSFRKHWSVHLLNFMVNDPKVTSIDRILVKNSLLFCIGEFRNDLADTPGSYLCSLFCEKLIKWQPMLAPLRNPVFVITKLFLYTTYAPKSWQRQVPVHWPNFLYFHAVFGTFCHPHPFWVCEKSSIRHSTEHKSNRCIWEWYQTLYLVFFFTQESESNRLLQT